MGKQYKLVEVSALESFKKASLVFCICFFCLVYSLVVDRGVEFILSWLFILVLILVGVAKTHWNSQKVFVTSDAEGLAFVKGNKKKSWLSIRKVELLRVQWQVMAAPTPEYVLYFNDGEKQIIDQRLKGYTDLYQELYICFIDIKFLVQRSHFISMKQI